MNSERWVGEINDLHEITLGQLADIYGPDAKIIPFILGLLKSKEENEDNNNKNDNNNNNDDSDVAIKIPLDILQEIKEELDKKSLLEQHPEFYPRKKQPEKKEKSAMVLLLKKMLEKLNEYDNIKDLDEREKDKICNELYSYFKEDINHNNIHNIFNVAEGETNQIPALVEKVITPEAVKEIINKSKKGGTLKKRKKKSRKKKLI